MQNALASRSARSTDRSMFRPLSEVASREPQWAQPAGTDQQFIAMLDSYRDSGGLARAQELVQVFKHRCGCDITPLASWIAGKKVICFEWQSETWLPLFQFNPLDMTLKPGLSLVLAELGSDDDAWEVANWFAQPNAWLGRCSPAATLALDPAAVLSAWRADTHARAWPISARSVGQRTEPALAFS